MEGLVVALRTYNPVKNSNLGAYVLQKLRWSILDALRVHRAGSRGDSAKGVFYAQVPLDEARDAAVAPAVDLGRIDLARAIEQLPPKRRAFIRAWLRLDDVAKAAAEIGVSTASGWQHSFQAVKALRKILDTQAETGA
jgi:DNA-directed RNA polymerase specialized sigma24 family protein